MRSLLRVWKRPVSVTTIAEGKPVMLRYDGKEHTTRHLASRDGGQRTMSRVHARPEPTGCTSCRRTSGSARRWGSSSAPRRRTLRATRAPASAGVKRAAGMALNGGAHRRAGRRRGAGPTWSTCRRWRRTRRVPEAVRGACRDGARGAGRPGGEVVSPAHPARPRGRPRGGARRHRARVGGGEEARRHETKARLRARCCSPWPRAARRAGAGRTCSERHDAARRDDRRVRARRRASAAPADPPGIAGTAATPAATPAAPRSSAGDALPPPRPATIPLRIRQRPCGRRRARRRRRGLEQGDLDAAERTMQRHAPPGRRRALRWASRACASRGSTSPLDYGAAKGNCRRRGRRATSRGRRRTLPRSARPSSSSGGRASFSATRRAPSRRCRRGRSSCPTSPRRTRSWASRCSRRGTRPTPSASSRAPASSIPGSARAPRQPRDRAHDGRAHEGSHRPVRDCTRASTTATRAPTPISAPRCSRPAISSARCRELTRAMQLDPQRASVPLEPGLRAAAGRAARPRAWPSTARRCGSIRSSRARGSTWRRRWRKNPETRTRGARRAGARARAVTRRSAREGEPRRAGRARRRDRSALERAARRELPAEIPSSP